MDNSVKEEKIVKSLMKHSRADMPFQDFDERMMDLIYKEERQQKSIRRDIRMAWMFFFLGLFLGLFIAGFTIEPDIFGDNIPTQTINMILQICIAVVLLFQLDRLLGFSSKRWRLKQYKQSS